MSSEVIHHGQQVIPFVATWVFSLRLMVSKLPNDSSQFSCSMFILHRLNIYHSKHRLLSSTWSSPVSQAKGYTRENLRWFRCSKWAKEGKWLTPPPLLGLWWTGWSESHLHLWTCSPPSCFPSDEPAGSTPLWPIGWECHLSAAGWRFIGSLYTRKGQLFPPGDRMTSIK